MWTRLDDLVPSNKAIWLVLRAPLLLADVDADVELHSHPLLPPTNTHTTHTTTMADTSHPPLSGSSKSSALTSQQALVQASANVQDRRNASAPFTRPSRDACANLKFEAKIPVASLVEDHMIRGNKGHEAGVRCACQWGVYLYHLDVGAFEAEFQW